MQTLEYLGRLFARDWIWLAVLDVVVALVCSVHIVLRKRDVRAALGWIGIVWLAPLIGSFAYFGFGINRIERRAAQLDVETGPSGRLVRPGPAPCRSDDAIRLLPPKWHGLVTLGNNLTHQPVCAGNRIQPLVDGDQAFPAMLQAIREAEQSISLVSYIFDSDRAGDAFFDALNQAHQRGVAVRVIIDGVGAHYSRPSMVRRLQAAGIPARSFLPTLIPRLFKYANLRNHRKILIVDGKIGFTGGTNIRELHWLTLQPRSPVHCLHFRIDGPVVNQMQRTFAVDWAFCTGERLQGPAWFAEVQPTGDVWARGISDGPDVDLEKLSDMIMGALASASESVEVVTPYFLPDNALIRALNLAALRGVEVRIYVPQTSNLPWFKWASVAQYWQLLEKGCRIFENPPPFDHSKLMVVDRSWSLIGSTNWDPRSLRLNFEFNLECYSPQLGGKLSQLIALKAAQAREITYEEVQNLWLPIRVRNGVARLISPYL